MRSSLVLYLAFAAAAAACGTDNAGQPQPDAGSGGDAALGAPDLDVISKDVTLDPHQEVTYCYYFHTPNTSNLAIKKWVSDMTDGSHHMIMFFDSGGGSPPPDGTLDSQNCGFGGGAGGTTSFPVWVYASQTMHGELDLPADDGTGKPLGMDVPPNTAAYFQMHYLNPGDTPIVAHVHLQGFAHPAGTTYTKTAAYITYNGNISIAPNAMNFAETQNNLV